MFQLHISPHIRMMSGLCLDLCFFIVLQLLPYSQPGCVGRKSMLKKNSQVWQKQWSWCQSANSWPPSTFASTQSSTSTLQWSCLSSPLPSPQFSQLCLFLPVCTEEHKRGTNWWLFSPSLKLWSKWILGTRGLLLPLERRSTRIIILSILCQSQEAHQQEASSLAAKESNDNVTGRVGYAPQTATENAKS